MNKTFYDMTEQERKTFETEFYALWAKFIPYPDDRQDVQPFRWGHPWKWCPDETAEPADDFFAHKKTSILKIYKHLESLGRLKRSKSVKDIGLIVEERADTVRVIEAYYDSAARCWRSETLRVLPDGRLESDVFSGTLSQYLGY